MTCPTTYAIAIHRTLEAMFSDSRTWEYFGPMANVTSPDQGGAKQLTRDPLTDIACQRPARSLGRAA